MSEFKYACPVCGQHMMCDSSQSGSVMECPTCFQKIVAPQAPATDDPKFILTGTKFAEKKIPTTLTNAAASFGAAPEKSFPVAIVIALVLVAAAAAGVFAFRGKIFKSSGGAPAGEAVSASDEDATPVQTPKLAKSAPVAPHASDTNWMLVLGTNAISDAPVAGRIHGQDFIVERASFQNGTLTLRAGTRGPVESGVQINFSGALPEALAGQTINVGTNADKAASVALRWKDDTGVQRENYDVGYAMRLEFGALEKNRLPGKIYLCTPDAQKSYLMGTFSADARKPKPKAPKK